jgi:hypothetical protein
MHVAIAGRAEGIFDAIVYCDFGKTYLVCYYVSATDGTFMGEHVQYCLCALWDNLSSYVAKRGETRISFSDTSSDAGTPLDRWETMFRIFFIRW